MSSDDQKHVQTALSPEEYERLRSIANERGLSIKEAGRQALTEWVERAQRADPDDPAFAVLDDLDDEVARPSTDARSEPDVVAEWSGDDVEFTLADDPSQSR